MTSQRILVADADPSVRRAIALLFEGRGYVAVEATTGLEALRLAAFGDIEAVVLDLGLHDGDALGVLRDLRRNSFVPVITVGSHVDVEERVLALEMGADDYLAKPFAPRELLARVRALLRRTHAAADPGDVYATDRSVDLDDLHIDVRARQVTIRGLAIELTTKEFDLLTFLARSPRQVFSRDDLLRGVWNSQTDWQDPATVTEHVRRIRQKIELDPSRPRLITTVRSLGYRFDSLSLSLATTAA